MSKEYTVSKFEIRTKQVDGNEIEYPVDLTGEHVEGRRFAFASNSQAADVIFRDSQHLEESGNIDRPRKYFMDRCMAELNMTKHGSSTYYHNKKRKDRGEDEYGLNKATNKKANERKKAEREAAKKDNAEPEQKVVAPEPKEVYRWQVIDATTNTLIDSFTTRSAAQEFNKEQKEKGNQTKWVDGEKKSA